MRGQLTVEYLFLALLALALIAISLGALIKARDAGERTYHLELFRSTAQGIYNSAEELCAMGSGNSLSLKARENVSISCSGGEMAFSSPSLNISATKNVRCPCSDAEVAADSEIEVRNEGGEISVS